MLDVIKINKRFVENNKEIDFVDAAILYYLQCEIERSNRQYPAEGENTVVYLPISYKQIIDDMPMLKIRTVGTMYRRIVALCDKGYISMDKRHKKVYMTLTKKYFEKVAI